MIMGMDTKFILSIEMRKKTGKGFNKQRHVGYYDTRQVTFYRS